MVCAVGPFIFILACVVTYASNNMRILRRNEEYGGSRIGSSLQAMHIHWQKLSTRAHKAIVNHTCIRSNISVNSDFQIASVYMVQKLAKASATIFRKRRAIPLLTANSRVTTGGRWSGLRVCSIHRRREARCWKIVGSLKWNASQTFGMSMRWTTRTAVDKDTQVAKGLNGDDSWSVALHGRE